MSVRHSVWLAFAMMSSGTVFALEPGDVIINEVYFNPRETWKDYSEGVELLVIKDNADLNGLVISDRDHWNRTGEEQCVLQDLGQGFLTSVPSGTLIVLHKGKGEDDIDLKDRVLRFHGKTSLFCNTAPTTNAFWLNDAADNVHVFVGEKQIDFIKFRASNAKNQGKADPGKLEWEKGAEGAVDVGRTDENAGIRFLGIKRISTTILQPGRRILRQQWRPTTWDCRMAGGTPPGFNRSAKKLPGRTIRQLRRSKSLLFW